MMSKKDELHRFDSDTGTSKVRLTTRGEIVIDSYMGELNGEHDRFTLNVSTGQVSGHGYDHKDKFDTATGKGCSKNNSQ